MRITANGSTAIDTAPFRIGDRILLKPGSTGWSTSVLTVEYQDEAGGWTVFATFNSIDKDAVVVPYDGAPWQATMATYGATEVRLGVVDLDRNLQNN